MAGGGVKTKKQMGRMRTAATARFGAALPTIKVRICNQLHLT
jgi:deoxyribose-phosphate aldolase